MEALNNAHGFQPHRWNMKEQRSHVKISHIQYHPKQMKMRI